MSKKKMEGEEMRKKIRKGIVFGIVFVLVFVVFAGIPMNVSAESFVLNPGYITGSINIPGHTIRDGIIRASGTDPETGQHYDAHTFIRTNTEYTLVVEGGDWNYRVYFTIYLDESNTPNPPNVLSHPYFATVSVGVGETVILDIEPDAVIEGTVSVQGETVQSIYVTASKFSSSAQYTTGNSYSLPVFSDNNIRVTAESVQLTDPNDYIHMGEQRIDVLSGETAVVNFNSVPGYVEGMVTIQGAQINGGTLGAQVYDPVERRYYRASTKISADGTFNFPLVPHLNYAIYGDIKTNLGNYGLETKYVDVFESETSVVNWEIVFDSSISGEVAIAGVNLDFIEVRGYGPHGAFRVSTLYTEGEYIFENLVPGAWGIEVFVYDRDYDLTIGYNERDFYYFPHETINLKMSEEYYQNFMFDAGYIMGNLFVEGSDAICFLKSYEIDASRHNSNTGERAGTTCSDLNLNDDNYINNYDFFVAPGEWDIRRIFLNYRYSHFPGYDTNSRFWIEYYYNPLPYITVNPGQIVQNDMNFQSALITANLRVATGEPFKWPSVQGSFRLPDETQGGVRVHSDVTGITEAQMTFHVLPATYTLTGKGNVQGASTTFGKIKLIVGPGDVIETDPDAPIVDIITPTGNYETTESCVTVSGTVTDESEITSFTINGNSVTIGTDGSFEFEVCGLTKGENVIEVYAEDEHGNSVTIERTVIVINTPPVADIGGPYVEFEGSEIIFDASGSTDLDGDVLQYRWDFDNDGVWDTEYSTSPTVPYTWNDDYSDTVVVEVYDGHVSTTSTTTVTILNAEPVITGTSATVDPTPVGYSVDFSAEFTDEGILDTRTATINWGDDTITDGIVTEADGSGTVTANRVYTTPGVYTVTVTLTDNDDASVSEEYRYVVVYDPDGSFITGGGQIFSPEGAYVADPTLSGKANFGFVSKYKNGATTPDGNTQFQFHAGDLSFHSKDYDWLVVAGKKGMFKGTGTINGEGNYGFILSAIDGDLSGGDGVDMFRIKIWNKDTDELVYDNNFGNAEDADPTTALTHGSIKIHKV